MKAGKSVWVNGRAAILAGALIGGAGMTAQAQVQVQQPPPHFTVIDLGPLPGGDFSQANALTNSGLVTGVSTVSDGTQHAIIWGGPLRIDIGPHGLNSSAFGINDKAQVSILGEISTKDPHNENFCAWGTGLECVGFLWQGGVLTQLPTLGGNNATIGNINNRGEIAGVAENSTLDPGCPPGVSSSGTGPQVLDYEAVVWGPKPGAIRELRPLAGDTVGMALWINDNSQAVGATGTCASSALPPVAFGSHAVRWDADGSAHDLGNLGGTINIGIFIDNQGDVSGVSATSDQSTPGVGVDAFLWTPQTGKMQDLGTLPGDVSSVGCAIDSAGDVVGPSFDKDGNPRAYIWRNGVMSELNDLVPANSPLYLLFPIVNGNGDIAGFGVNEKGEVHGFLALPDTRGPGRADVAAAAGESGVDVPWGLPASMRAAALSAYREKTKADQRPTPRWWTVGR